MFWERYGGGEPPVLFLSTWTIIHARRWKAQIPYLAPHFCVLTFDPRGNGRSDAKTLIASTLGDLAVPATRRDQTALAGRVRCPVLVISSPNDRIHSHADARALVRITGGELLGVPRGGHCPQARKPVTVNLALRDFIRTSSFTADSRQLRATSTRG